MYKKPRIETNKPEPIAQFSVKMTALREQNFCFGFDRFHLVFRSLTSSVLLKRALERITSDVFIYNRVSPKEFDYCNKFLKLLKNNIVPNIFYFFTI